MISSYKSDAAKWNSALSIFEAPKAELAAELTDTLENIRYLFEINAAIMV